MRWVDVRTGLWADPALYEASRDTDRLLVSDALRQVGRMLQGGNPLGAAMDMVAQAQAMQVDMRELTRMNACNGPGLKRFGENLRLFARNQPGLEDGPAKVSAVTVPVPGLPFRDQNYTKLVEDLVTVQAATWVMNRYQHGSVGNVTVDSRDAAGRPAGLSASYLFQSADRQARGRVSVSFRDGLPVCLFFSDAPNTCRSADRRIGAKYASGGYEK